MEEANSINQEIDSEGQGCSICLNPYDTDCHKPMSIPSCPHDICKICSEVKILKECPLCRIEIPKGSVLQPNISLMNLLRPKQK